MVFYSKKNSNAKIDYKIYYNFFFCYCEFLPSMVPLASRYFISKSFIYKSQKSYTFYDNLYFKMLLTSIKYVCILY